MRKLEVFFDYECPYCKRGHGYLEELIGSFPDIEIEWRPCESHPYPEVHPPHSYYALQTLLYAIDKGIDVSPAAPIHRALYQALAVERRELEKINEITAAAKDVLDPDDLAAALLRGAYAEQQQDLNDYAYDEQGVWFVPSFRMDGRKLDAKGGAGVQKSELEAFLKG